MSRLLTSSEIADQLTGLPLWHGSTDQISATYEFPTFMDAIGGVQGIAIEAEEMDHHPDIDIRWRKVTFTACTHSAGGVTQLDIELAHRIHHFLFPEDA
jgi:4a-hydroxytetrahydrobiopterin dehydratase